MHVPSPSLALRLSAALALTAAMAPSQAQAPAAAADLDAGRARATSVCGACHGSNGVSVTDAIPNLAGQRAAYLSAQLEAFKSGARKAPVMNAMAAPLSSADMANVAAFYASLPGSGNTAQAKSEPWPQVARSAVRFPEGYQASFTKYHTINFPATRQVRHYFANPVALAAAREGKPLPDGAVLFAEVWQARLDADKKPVTGPDGFFVPEQLVGYTAMERQAGWGREIPEALRNEDWNYAAFSTAKAQRPVNHAECLACHKPLDKESYTFTLAQLKAVATRR